MSVADDQARRLDNILPWARLAGDLIVSLRPHEHCLHLRASATGIRVVDLSPERPQLDRGKIASVAGAALCLQQIMASSSGASARRSTPEKALQSWLIAQGVSAPPHDDGSV